MSEEAVRRKSGGGSPGKWKWAKDGEAEEPCEVRESLRQVEKAQGKVRKPKCQKRED